jgi:hypothetical protein
LRHKNNLKLKHWPSDTEVVMNSWKGAKRGLNSHHKKTSLLENITRASGRHTAVNMVTNLPVQ